MQRPHPEQGVVLLEAIVAVGILSVIFASVFNLMVRSVTAVRVSNDQLVASYLAQDAAEYIIAKKEYNARTSNPNWLAGIQCAAANCSINTNSSDLSNGLAVCTPGSTCGVNFDSATGLYGGGGAASIFERYVTSTLVNAAEWRYTVTVTWPSGSSNESVTLSFNLYDE